MLEQFRSIEKAAENSSLTFADATRLLAGAAETEANEWGRISAGPWLAKTLENLRRPESLAHAKPIVELKATLRPYQRDGVEWLHLLSTLGLGACLADDMGLGKTMQVLALLLVLRRNPERSRQTSLLVAPASLLANWASEIELFSPDLR